MTKFTRVFSLFAATITTVLLAIAPLSTPATAADVSVSGHARSEANTAPVIADRALLGAMAGTVAA